MFSAGNKILNIYGACVEERRACTNLPVLIIDVLTTFLIAPSLGSSLMFLFFFFFSPGGKNNQILFASVNIYFFALEEIIISIVAWR